MDEPITSDEEVVTGAGEALPEESQESEAALVAQEQEEGQPQTGDEESVPQVDDKLQSFAKGLGIEDVSSLSDRELKLLKVAKDNQAEYQRNAQKASELEKTISKGTRDAIDSAAANGEDPVNIALAEIASLKLQTSVNGFFSNNPEAKEHEQEMVKLVTDRPEIGQLVRQGALSVSDLYAMVKGLDGSAVEEAETKGAKKALQQLANKQLAKAVPGSATTSALSPSEKKDPFLEGFDSQ